MLLNYFCGVPTDALTPGWQSATETCTRKNDMCSKMAVLMFVGSIAKCVCPFVMICGKAQVMQHDNDSLGSGNLGHLELWPHYLSLPTILSSEINCALSPPKQNLNLWLCSQSIHLQQNITPFSTIFLLRW